MGVVGQIMVGLSREEQLLHASPRIFTLEIVEGHSSAEMTRFIFHAGQLGQTLLAFLQT